MLSFFQFCDSSESGDHPQRDLTKFGQKLKYGSKLFVNHPSIVLTTQVNHIYRNPAIFLKFLLNYGYSKYKKALKFYYPFDFWLHIHSIKKGALYLAGRFLLFLLHLPMYHDDSRSRSVGRLLEPRTDHPPNPPGRLSGRFWGLINPILEMSTNPVPVNHHGSQIFWNFK